MRQKQITNNITEYIIGNPTDTDAVVLHADGSFTDCGGVPYFETAQTDGGLRLSKNLGDSEAVYGLGQALGGLNKRGRIYRCYNTDDPNHTPEKQSLYGSHPFVIFDDKTCFGLFVDYPGELIFDIGFCERAVCTIDIAKNAAGDVNVKIYLIEGSTKAEIVHHFLLLVGAPFMPPKWAFGYQQSRWSYPTAEAVLDICRRFRQNDIPCDAVYLDLDYMDDYKVFTTSQERFPQFAAFVEKAAADGFHIVPIIDPGVKVEPDYEIYCRAKANGFFCKTFDAQTKQAADEDFVATVWPGRTSLPDFLNASVRRWWGDLYKRFCDIGVNAFWNDMNEPALFFTARGLDELFACYDEVRSRANPGLDFFDLKDKVNALSNNRADYKSFCHNVGGNIVCHDDVHNIYGFNMVKASADGLKRHSGGLRYFLLSRSSYIGQHRYSAVWTGDNQSWWEHIIVHIRLIQSMNMCGFFFVGSDIPGFGCDADAQLLVRWLQAGVVTPFFRNHAALFTRNQEPWAFDDGITDIARNVIKLRYALLPYIYSEYHNCVRYSYPLVQPLSFVFDEAQCCSIDDQYMFGSSVMAAPVYLQNAAGRFVFLPSCRWLLWRASQYDKRDMRVCQPGASFYDCELNQMLIFIRENTLLVLTEPGKNTDAESDTLIVTGLVTDTATYHYYDDDGKTYNYDGGLYGTIKIIVAADGADYRITCKYNAHAGYPNRIRQIKFELYNAAGVLTEKSLSLSGSCSDL